MRGRLAAQLLAAIALLSWCVGVRLPAETPLRDWLLPSPDIAVLLASMSLFAPRPDWRPSRTFLWLTSGVLLAVRCARIAEGISRRFLDRPFHLVSDLALLPELARLSLSTLGPLRLGLALFATLAVLALLWVLLVVALRQAARALSWPRVGDAYLVVAGILALLSLGLLPLIGASQASLFADPVSPRVVHEVELWLTARGLYDDPAHATQRRAFMQLLQRRQARLRATPAALDHLRGVDVHVLLVEAYGHTVMSTPEYAKALAPAYRELSAALDRAGFSLCTDFVRATTFGGSSWLTHATLETAVPVADQFEYALLLERAPVLTLARAFHKAGYRTVSVKPGTTRASPQTRIYGFDREYVARDFGYHGPAFAWAPMPDQFVLQKIAERELREAARPLFIEYALVSSHFPFTPHPPLVEDWGALGDGSVFHRLLPVQIAQGQGKLSASALAYLSSVRYELRVLGDFLSRYVRDDALVLILGDHQPIAPVAAEDRSRSTPLHVLSRRDSLLRPFRDRGCVPGLISQRPGPHRTMEDLAIDLLHDFSSP